MPHAPATSSSVLKILTYPLAFLTLPLLVGVTTAAAYLTAPPPPAPAALTALPTPPVLDPARPTVAVVLGSDLTEVADALAPYAVFRAADAFNVVTVAETQQPVTLTGTLDVLPHFTFAQLDARLGHAPDVIVVPNVPHLQANEALRHWVRRHGQGRSMVLSVCAGADMVGAAGLLDGRPATTHWGDIARIERAHPAARWVRGQRYIDDGQVISTAGILSGVDGALHLIARLRGDAVALKTAQTLHYDAKFLKQTAMVQFHPSSQDVLVTLLNLMYRWDRPAQGVALQDGVDELTLAALYDTTPSALAGRLVSVAPHGTVVTTRYGLHLVARQTPAEWGARPLLIPDTGHPSRPPAWTAPFPRRPALSMDGHFPFDTALADLAHRTDRPTADLAARRLEFRTSDAPLSGRGWWTAPIVLRPIALGLLSVVLTFVLERLLRSRRRILRRAAGLRSPVPQASGNELPL